MRKAVIVAIAGGVMLVVAAVALAVPATQTLTYKETFAAKKPKTSTTTAFSTSSSDPANSANNNQPVASTEVDIKFPAGTAIDTTSVPNCTATDNQVIQTGGKACAAKTKIATGTATAELPGGFSSAPINVVVTGYAGKKQLILYVQPTVGQAFVLRALLTGNLKNGPTLVAKVPPNCLPPSVNQNGRCVNPNGGKAQEAVLTSFTLKTLKKSSGSGKKKKNFLTSPTKCPASKKWSFTGTFKYEDGTQRSLTSTSPCTK